MQGAYFLGKALWDKGHGDLMDLLQAHEAKHGQVRSGPPQEWLKLSGM